MSDTAEQSTSVAAPGIKIATAWLATLFTSWTEAAAFIAFVYTLCLLLEWLWRRIGRPIAENRGWIRRLRRRASDWRDRE